ncbi:MAG TPA: hypothetical protein VHB50_08535 [Bryobacteraceae bacterium]|nr:hypothetical protein [Bryobacteraceae bacterium]
MTSGLVGALILYAAIVSADVVGFGVVFDGSADPFRKIVVVSSKYMQTIALERVLSEGKAPHSAIVMAFWQSR